jgi:hypothetical protein
MPRLSSTERTTIVNPATGLIVYDNTTSTFWYYDGLDWAELSLTPAVLPNTLDGDGDTEVTTEYTTDDDEITFLSNGVVQFAVKGPLLEVHNSGKSVFLGNNAGALDDLISNWNVFLGESSGATNVNGQYNVAVGGNALQNGTLSNNVAVGFNALLNTTVGEDNVALGRSSGRNNLGSGNVFLGNLSGYHELGSNKLYIENSVSANPLIWGDFENDSVRINGVLSISGNYFFPRAAGSNNQILMTNGNGNLSWQDVPGDDLGKHMATQNIQLDTMFLSGDGDDEGVFVSNDGDVGIGIKEPANLLHLHEITNIGNFISITNNLTGTTNLDGFQIGINNSMNARIRNFENTDMIFYNDNDEKLRLRANGDLVLADGTPFSATGGEWQVNSDERLKRDITPFAGDWAIKKLKELVPVQFYWNDTVTSFSRPETVQYGFTAQNIQTCFPDFVKEDNLGYLTTSYGTYDALFVQAIQELSEQNEELESRLQKLEQELEEIKTLLNQ